MKKLLFAIIILSNAIALTQAQIAFTKEKIQTAEVFSDNFDSYTSGAYLGSVAIPNYTGSYSGWGTSNSVTVSGTVFHSGTMSARLNTNKANNFCSLRRTIAVTTGHNYTFSAWTYYDAGTKACQVAYQFNTTTSVKGSTSDQTLAVNTWNLQSITFTAATSENVDVYVSAYLYAAVVNVYSDDWLVVDNSAYTAVNNVNNTNFELIQSTTGKYELKGIEVASGKVYSSQGKLVKSFNTNIFNIDNLAKGVYMLTATDKNSNSFAKKFIN